MSISDAQAQSAPMVDSNDPESLVKSRQRVADHGEVFTSSWMVDAMLNLVKDESERIDSRFLEPACGSGNFLKAVLLRKFKTVELKYGKSAFERSNHALMALMCIDANVIIKAQDKHLREVVKAGDAAHEEALKAMKGRWKNPFAGMGWYNQVKKDFASLSEN